MSFARNGIYRPKISKEIESEQALWYIEFSIKFTRIFRHLAVQFPLEMTKLSAAHPQYQTLSPFSSMISFNILRMFIETFLFNNNNFAYIII